MLVEVDECRASVENQPPDWKHSLDEALHKTIGRQKLAFTLKFVYV